MRQDRHEVRVRPARADEIEHVLALWGESREWLGKTDDVTSLRKLLDRDRDALLVAEQDGRIVGSLIAAWDGWRGNMYRLTIHPDFRRRGLAQLLVSAGDKQLETRGARRITALVWKEDSRAMSTWLSAGYEHEDGTGRFVKTLTS